MWGLFLSVIYASKTSAVKGWHPLFMYKAACPV